MTDSVTVLMPTSYGDLAVVDLDQLVGYLAGGDDLTTAVRNAAFDHISLSNLDVLRLHLGKVFQLNIDGDANAYWERT